jgi:hypothetical protein
MRFVLNRMSLNNEPLFKTSGRKLETGTDAGGPTA